MGLETPTWIADLNPSNPGATDLVSQGDDHIRNLKTALQNTFPFASRPFPIPSTVTKTASYQVSSADQNKTIAINTGSGAVVVTLPALTATDYGWKVSLIKFTTDSNPILVKPSSGSLFSGQLTLSSTRRALSYCKFDCEWIEGSWLIERCIRLPVGTTINNFMNVLPVGYEYAAGVALASSTLYPDYFSANGSSLATPDLQGRAEFGRTDMDGSDNGLMAGTGVTGTSLGSTGGTGSVVIAQANLPAVSLNMTSSTVAVAISDPGHTHTMANGASIVNNLGGGLTISAGNPYGITAITENSQTTGITASGTFGGQAALGGSGTKLVTLPPIYIVNKLLVVE